MAPGEVSGLKNGEPVMAGVLGGDYKDRMADRLTCMITINTGMLIQLLLLLMFKGECFARSDRSLCKPSSCVSAQLSTQQAAVGCRNF